MDDPLQTGHPPYEIVLDVQDGEIDPLGHVNNVVDVRWIQDVAAAHWRALASAAQQAATAWVVVRHEIDYKRPALRGDRVLARTWVGSATRAVFERHTEILRESDRGLLARARTLWCPVDPGSGRPRDVGAEVRRLFSSGGPTS